MYRGHRAILVILSEAKDPLQPHEVAVMNGILRFAQNDKALRSTPNFELRTLNSEL